MSYADSLGFVALPGKPPLIDPQTRPKVSVVHLTSVPPMVKTFDDALAAHDAFKKTALANKDVTHVCKKSDLPVLPPFIGMLFGMQHAPEDITKASQVRELAEHGVQFMALAYEGKTRYGSGFLADGGLTEEGKRLIRWMGDCGIALDVSHANNQTAEEALRFIKSERIPIFPLASHSGAGMAFAHPRNLSDEVLYLLYDTGGYVGIPMVTFLICSPKMLEKYPSALVHHVIVARILCHKEQVGIGSDCFYGEMTMDEARGEYARMTAMLKTNGRFGEYFPDRPEVLITDGTRLMRHAEKMLAAKFPEKEVRNLCGGNFIRYLRRVLPD